MIEERRWPIGSKKSVIHAGEGVIADIKWRGNYIVWANDTVSDVHMYLKLIFTIIILHHAVMATVLKTVFAIMYNIRTYI